jgi:RNA polymerase sigma factor (sigma-70 family)
VRVVGRETPGSKDAVVSEALDDQERFCAGAWPRLVGAVAHYCGDVHVAEELVQEALLRACRRWTEVSKLASPEGWTYRVAINLANSAWRRRRAERRARARHGPPETVADRVEVETQWLIRSALAELSVEQRDGIILRFVLDLSAEQAAAVLGTTAGAVRARTHRGVQHLRSLLREPCTSIEESHDGR